MWTIQVLLPNNLSSNWADCREFEDTPCKFYRPQDNVYMLSPTIGKAKIRVVVNMFLTSFNTSILWSVMNATSNF